MLSIYVDESGNLGEQGRFFVIAAFVTINGKRVKNIVRRFCSARKLAELKNRDLSFDDRQDVLKSLCAGDDHYFSYVCLDKTKLKEKKLFQDKNVLFNYLLGFLLKPIVRRNLTSDIVISLDNRTLKVTSVHSLPDYIRSKMHGDWDFEKDVAIHYVDSKQATLVQAADLGAGIILERYKLGKTHFYDKLCIKDRIRFPYDGFNEPVA